MSKRSSRPGRVQFELLSTNIALFPTYAILENSFSRNHHHFRNIITWHFVEHSFSFLLFLATSSFVSLLGEEHVSIGRDKCNIDIFLLNIVTHLDLSFMQMQYAIFPILFQILRWWIARMTTMYTFRLDGSHSAPICGPRPCKPKPGPNLSKGFPNAGMLLAGHVFIALSAAKKFQVKLKWFFKL